MTSYLVYRYHPGIVPGKIYITKKLKCTPAVRSEISSKLVFATCVQHSDRAYYRVCALIKNIDRRLLFELACTRVNGVMLINLCTESIKTVLDICFVDPQRIDALHRVEPVAMLLLLISNNTVYLVNRVQKAPACKKRQLGVEAHFLFSSPTLSTGHYWLLDGIQHRTRR